MQEQDHNPPPNTTTSSRKSSVRKTSKSLSKPTPQKADFSSNFEGFSQEIAGIIDRKAEKEQEFLKENDENGKQSASSQKRSARKYGDLEEKLAEKFEEDRENLEKSSNLFEENRENTTNQQGNLQENVEKERSAKKSLGKTEEIASFSTKKSPAKEISEKKLVETNEISPEKEEILVKRSKSSKKKPFVTEEDEVKPDFLEISIEIIDEKSKADEINEDFSNKKQGKSPAEIIDESEKYKEFLETSRKSSKSKENPQEIINEDDYNGKIDVPLNDSAVNFQAFGKISPGKSPLHKDQQNHPEFPEENEAKTPKSSKKSREKTQLQEKPPESLSKSGKISKELEKSPQTRENLLENPDSKPKSPLKLSPAPILIEEDAPATEIPKKSLQKSKPKLLRQASPAKEVSGEEYLSLLLQERKEILRSMGKQVANDPISSKNRGVRPTADEENEVYFRPLKENKENDVEGHTNVFDYEEMRGNPGNLQENAGNLQENTGNMGNTKEIGEKKCEWMGGMTLEEALKGDLQGNPEKIEEKRGFLEENPLNEGIFDEDGRENKQIAGDSAKKSRKSLGKAEQLREIAEEPAKINWERPTLMSFIEENQENLQEMRESPDNSPNFPDKPAKLPEKTKELPVEIEYKDFSLEKPSPLKEKKHKSEKKESKEEKKAKKNKEKKPKNPEKQEKPGKTAKLEKNPKKPPEEDKGKIAHKSGKSRDSASKSPEKMPKPSLKPRDASKEKRSAQKNTVKFAEKLEIAQINNPKSEENAENSVQSRGDSRKRREKSREPGKLPYFSHISRRFPIFRIIFNIFAGNS